MEEGYEIKRMMSLTQIFSVFNSAVIQCLLLVCVCVCVCVCVFVCVYTYSFTINASSACNDVQGILEGMDQRSCVVSIILEKRHISPRKMNSSSRETRKKRYDIC